MTQLSEAEIAAISAQPFDPSRAEVVHRPDSAKKVLSARVPEAISDWIVADAVRRGISPSLVTAELLADAIAIREQGPRRLTAEELRDAARTYAEFLQQPDVIAELTQFRATIRRTQAA